MQGTSWSARIHGLWHCKLCPVSGLTQVLCQHLLNLVLSGPPVEMCRRSLRPLYVLHMGAKQRLTLTPWGTSGSKTRITHLTICPLIATASFYTCSEPPTRLAYTGAAWDNSSLHLHPCHMDGCWIVMIAWFSSGCHFHLCLLLYMTLCSVKM